VRRGDERVELSRPRLRVSGAGSGGRRRTSRGDEGHDGPRVAGGAAPPGVDPADEDLFVRLRALRRRLAEEQSVPAYVVFSDATLRDMARRRPASEADFLLVNGVGAAKCARYADPFLAEIEAVPADGRPGTAASAG
jgi:ATP-dependent DNA helicase RecQ